jgi:hypothetical protein
MRQRKTAKIGVYGALIICASTAAQAGPTGLNSIPTTDIVPLNNWIANLQNSNTMFKSPAFYSAPMIFEQTQFALSSRVEAGVDSDFLPDRNANEFVFNAKMVLQNEDDRRPNAAIGIANIANHLIPNFYLTFSKTLNYDQEQKERYRAHHRRNRKLLGRRIHAGLMADARGTLQPFVGADLQMSESTVFQTDWINGSGNAITLGFAYVLSDQRTVLNPAFLYSNSAHRLDGFFINISRQFGL